MAGLEDLILRLRQLNHELVTSPTYGCIEINGSVINLRSPCGCYRESRCSEHWPEEEARLRALNSPAKNPRSKTGGQQYAFTLTLPVGAQPVKPLLEVAKNIMEFGITNSPSEKADKYAYVLEYTEKGTPHIHGIYSTKSGRRIAAKYFARYHTHDKWVKKIDDPHFWNEKMGMGQGHRGGYHAPVRHGESYEGYLEKEGVVVKSATPPN